MRKVGWFFWLSVMAMQGIGCDRTPGGEKAEGAQPPRTGDVAKGGVLRALHEANQQNVRSSQMAQDRGQAAEIRRYAAALLHDDTDMDNRLLSLAKSENVDLVPLPEPVPMALSRAADKLERTLSAASGRDFDAAYLAPQVLLEEYVAGLLEQAEKTSPGKEMSLLIADAERQTTDWLAEARRLSAALVYPAATGGGPAADDGLKKDAGSVEKASHVGAPGAPARKDAK